MSLSTSSSSPPIPRHFAGNGIGNQFSNHYRPQRKNHPRAAGSSSSSVGAATSLSSSRSLTALSALSSSRRRSSRSRSRSFHRGSGNNSGNVSGNVSGNKDEGAFEAGKPSTNAYRGNSRSRSQSRSRLAAARPLSSSSSFHTTTTAAAAATTSHSNHRSHHSNSNHQKKYQPAFEGAKFDTSGYCLKHPMMRLCQPTTAEKPSTTTATTTVKYQILRKTCPLCGEHALRNERKLRSERNRNAPHGYYRRSDDDDHPRGSEDRSRSRTRELLTAGSGNKSVEEERRDSIASRSMSSSSSSASFFGSGGGGGSGSGRRSSRRESVSRVQHGHHHGPDHNDDGDGDAANSDYCNLVSRLSVCSTASASAYGRRGTTCSSSESTSSTIRRRRSTSSTSSRSHSQMRSALRKSETRRNRERDPQRRDSTTSLSNTHCSRSKDDDHHLSIPDSKSQGGSGAQRRSRRGSQVHGKRHGLDPSSSSVVPSSSSSVPSSPSSSSSLPLALIPSNRSSNAYTRHDGSHDSASQNVRRRNDSHVTIASSLTSKEYRDNSECKTGNANRIVRNRPNESNEGDKPGTRMRRLHTTEALMNHHHDRHDRRQQCPEDLFDGRDRLTLRNSSRRDPISGDRLKIDRASASIRNDEIDTIRPGSNDGENSSIPRSKSMMCHVDSDGNNNNNNNNTVSSNRRNDNTGDNNEEGTEQTDTSTIQTSKSHISQQSRSSSITRTIRSKLEERIQSRRQRRRATVSSFHRSLYGGEPESVDNADDDDHRGIRVRASASVRGSENGDTDNITVSTGSAAKSRFASSGGRDISFRVLSTKEDDRPQERDRHGKSPHQESKRGRSFLRHFGNSGSHGSETNRDKTNGEESTHRENSLVSKRADNTKPETTTTAAPTPSTSSSTLSLSTPSLTTASDSSSSFERNNAFSTRNDHHPASRSYSTKSHRRRSLSRNARRVLEATSVMDGNKDAEPSLSLKFEVPFHPVTGMCHYHPSVCMAVRDAGNKRGDWEETEEDGGWRVVREVCPKCRRGG